MTDSIESAAAEPSPGPDDEPAVDWCEVQTRDRHRLTRQYRRARHAAPRARIVAQARESAARTAIRRNHQADVTLTEGLPITAHANDIVAAVAASQVVVVCGETGSGKTTQLPKLLMQAGYGARGLIGHTQPRRLAARSVSGRIAEETGTEIGDLVGFVTRFDKQVGQANQVQLMTDGILLAQIGRDRFLNTYEVLIVDEAHERTLNIDFILGYLKRLLSARPDLKVIVTSATIDPDRFARFFDDQPQDDARPPDTPVVNVPVINIEGRGYPVDIWYRPPGQSDALPEAIADAVEELWRQGPGDVLVFLPGERDIRDTERHLTHALAATRFADAHIVALYARLTRAAQDRVFATSNGRRVVLATNVAETSLTVPGIRYVVDSGLARISRYSPAARVQRLPIEPISQASGRQRAGRCGRVAPGICIRLFEESEWHARPAFTDPEIRRTNLASVLLTMANLKLGAIEDFAFIDPPDRRVIRDGRNLLVQLKALDDGRITRLGRKLARLPLDPRIARMVIAGDEHGVPVALRVLAAGLTIADPRERPAQAREAADAAQRPFADSQSDFLALLKLWDAFNQARRTQSGNQLRRWCRDHYVNFMRMREWEDLARQIRRIGHDIGLSNPTVRTRLAEGDYPAIHQALLTGLIDHVGQLNSKSDKQATYRGIRGRRFRIFPGSNLARRSPKWLVASELIETRALYAHNAARIEPAWIEKAAGHLVAIEHYDPHWEKRRGQVVARERVKLYGLTLSDGRKRDYGRIDAAAAREIFIRDGLVLGSVVDKRGQLPNFLAQNQSLIEDISSREARFRRADLLVDETTQAAFYDARLAPEIYDRTTLQRWLSQNDDAALFFDQDSLLRHGGLELPEADYPQTLRLGDVDVALEYAFEPGQACDGATARIPLALVNRIPAEAAEWGVPGWLQTRFEQYLKALPKRWRRMVAPVGEFARAAAERVEFGRGDPTAALREAIRQMTGVALPAESWASFEPSPHLRLRFEVIDDDGNRLAAGRDISTLQQRLDGYAHRQINASSDHQWAAQGLTDWPEQPLPESVTLHNVGAATRAVPVLRDRGNAVDLELVDTPARAAPRHRQGVIRLARIAAARQIRLIKRDLPNFKRLAVLSIPNAPAGARLDGETRASLACDSESWLTADFINALVAAHADEPPRGQASFGAWTTYLKRNLVAEASALWSDVEPVLTRWQYLRKRLSATIPPDRLTAIGDMRDQLDHLIYVGFITELTINEPRCADLSRYLAGIEQRLDKLQQDGPEIDRRRALDVERYWHAYKQGIEQGEARANDFTALSMLRWMIEEYRIQIFAQSLGTAMKVSAKRLDTQCDRAGCGSRR